MFREGDVNSDHNNKQPKGSMLKKLVPKDIADNENSVENLLVHMRQVRAAIPVNQKLREELRAYLVQSQGKAENFENFSVISEDLKNQKPAFGLLPEGADRQPLMGSLAKPFRKEWCWGLSALLLLVAAGWIWWSFGAPKYLAAGHSREITRFWSGVSPLDMVAGSKQQGLLVIRDGGVSLLDGYGNQFGLINPSLGQSYISAAWSQKQDQLALVRRTKDRENEIIRVDLPFKSGLDGADQKKLASDLNEAEVIYTAEKGQHLSDLVWSPDGKTLALTTEDTQGILEVGLISPGQDLVRIGSGRHPTWSPDGSRLVVERPGSTSGASELWLVNEDGSRPVCLLEGKKPVWGSYGYLVYVQVTDTERVLAYDLDGSPLFKVQQRSEEIRTINLGRNGESTVRDSTEGRPLHNDQLLMVPDNQPGIYELNWLRQLELAGVREPKTLLLDQLNWFYTMEFGADGKTLLIARRDGGMVVLEQIGLQKKLVGAR